MSNMLSGDDELEYTPPSRWPRLLVLALLLGGAGYFIYGVTNAPDPLKVLVVVDFDGRPDQGSTPAAKLADAVTEQLADLGFVPAKLGDPKVVEALENHGEDLQRAASQLGASFVVEVKIEPEFVDHPIDGGYTEIRARGTVRTYHLDDVVDEAQTEKIVSWGGSRKRERALARLSTGTLADQAAARAATQLLAHETIAERLSGDVNTMVQLLKAKRYVDARLSALAEAKKKYDQFKGAREDRERGKAVVTYHGDFDTELGLAGAGPRGALVMTEGKELVYSFKMSLGWLERLETVSWQSGDGPPTPIWTGYNVYGYPGVSADGKTVALSEDLYGWAKTITVVTDGTPRRLAVDPKHYFTALSPSPQGTWLAGYDRTCKKCDGRVFLRDVTSGKQRWLLDPEGGHFQALAWASETALLVLHKSIPAPDDGEDTRLFRANGGYTLWRLNPSEATPTPVLVFGAEPGQRLGWLQANETHSILSVRGSTGQGLMVINLTDGQTTLIPTPSRVTSPDLSPDGKTIAFNLRQGGDEEVAVVPITGGEPTVLTRNGNRDRYPKFSRDGARIYFESLGRDPNFPRRHVGVLASIPTP